MSEALRDRMIELRARERELEDLAAATSAELAHNRAEQERTKRLLITDAQAGMRLKSVSTKETARATVARMGTFTFGELQSELGWEKARVKKLMDAMACEKPPAVVPDGRAMGKALFRYTGPAIAEPDPLDQRDRAALEAISDWVRKQTTTFTPGEAAAACETTRTSALRALRALQSAGALVDESPTTDHPVFRREDVDVPDVALAPLPKVAEVLSKVPQINELLVAARDAGCEVTSSNGHHAVEFLDGRRVLIPAKPQGRAQMMNDKARLRRMGVNV